MIRLLVYGTPVPQGSAKAFALRKDGQPTGRAAVTHDNPRTLSWRQAIVDQVTAHLDSAPGQGWEKMTSRPVSVSLSFVLPRPKGHYGTGRNAEVLRPSAPAYPAGKPDLDKLCRAVLDALTDAGVWRDDCQVITLDSEKCYAGPRERPGMSIEVRRAPQPA